MRGFYYSKVKPLGLTNSKIVSLSNSAFELIDFIPEDKIDINLKDYLSGSLINDTSKVKILENKTILLLNILRTLFFSLKRKLFWKKKKIIIF